MDKTVRKAFLLGLGISLLTKEKVEKEAANFMRANGITAKEGKKLAAAIIRNAELHRKDIEQKVENVEREILGSVLSQKETWKTAARDKMAKKTGPKTTKKAVGKRQ